MLLKLAWRNIWRNKRRSLIVLLSVIVGVNAILIMDGMSNGMLSQMLFNQISLNVSHIQIHSEGFNDNKTIKNSIKKTDEVENVIRSNKQVEYFSKRVVTFGLLSSASNSTGVYINGINPDVEQHISRIKSSIIEGKYFAGSKRDIVIGQRLAENLKVELGDKVVALANTPDGSIGSDVFRIVGIYKSPSSEFDKTYIYIPIITAQEMLDIPGQVHEFAMILKDHKLAGKVTDELKTQLPNGFEVLSYENLLPYVIIQLELYGEMLFIINFIIGLALIFGIINSMLMSVFERINEIGVLMSIGMKNWKIFLMILFEALIIGIAGTTVGVVSGYLISLPLGVYGIDLSIFAESLESFAMGSVLYPQLSLENFLIVIFMIPFISLLGAIYPAVKAIRLEPVYAIRYV